VCLYETWRTLATLTLLGGANLKSVTEALAHSDVAFTLQMYSQLSPGIQKAAMRRLDRMPGPDTPGVTILGK